jgi:hypothetical protein
MAPVTYCNGQSSPTRCGSKATCGVRLFEVISNNEWSSAVEIDTVIGNSRVWGNVDSPLFVRTQMNARMEKCSERVRVLVDILESKA